MIALDKEQKSELRLLILSVFIYAVVLIFGKLAGGEGIQHTLSIVAYFTAYIWIAWPVIREAFENICEGDFLNEEFLMLLATFGALAIGEYSEAIAVMVFFQAGEFMQDLAVERSRASVAQLMDIAPSFARVIREGKTEQIKPEELKIGDEIEIHAGEKIPVDCVVVSGQSNIDTASLTGEAIPVVVSAGSELLSGSINGNGLLRARVAKLYEDSAVAKILELVEHASEKKARTERFITRFARYYTPVVITAAALLAVVPVCFGGEWNVWVYRACMFLVVSCPCALVISVPMGFFCGIGAASRNGILVKGGTALENAATLDTMVFDKTGTLTAGRFGITAVKAFGITEAQLRSLAAALEQGSNHPIAQAIRHGAETVNSVANFSEVLGKGVQGEIDGVRYGLGNAQILALFHASLDEKAPDEGTAVYLCSEGKCLGWLLLEDALKDEAVSTMEELRRHGLQQLVMLTGDRAENAQRLADKLGFDAVHASLLPQDKVAVMESLLQKSENAGYAGDGINDAPVLMRSKVGVAMGAIGSDAAIEAADVVLVSDSLSRLPVLVGIAKKTMRLVRENIVFALGVKFAVLIFGAFGMANMWWAIFADVGVCILTIANASRAFCYRSNA